MNVSSTSAAQFSQQYDVTVAAKALDQQKQNGETAKALIASAAPPPRGGQTISVFA